jgi:hypothetical protein
MKAELKRLKKNDLVWAKLRGYPWWPAVVSSQGLPVPDWRG